MKKKNVISLGLFLLLIVLTFVYRSQKQNRENFIKTNGQPAIGEVYTFSTYSRSGSSIKYKYHVNRMHYSQIGKSIPEWLQKGDKFIVMYLEKDPRESILLLDYPIKDSIDFQNYIKENGLEHNKIE